jgi:hypothetical protein
MRLYVLIRFCHFDLEEKVLVQNVGGHSKFLSIYNEAWTARNRNYWRLGSDRTSDVNLQLSKFGGKI